MKKKRLTTTLIWIGIASIAPAPAQIHSNPREEQKQYIDAHLPGKVFMMSMELFY